MPGVPEQERPTVRLRMMRVSGCCLRMPAGEAARSQEFAMLAGHGLCELVEQRRATS